MTHDEYARMIKSTLSNLVIKSVLSVLTAYLPWMAWGPFRYMAEWVITKVITIAFDQTEMAIFFEYVDMRTSKQGREFDAAALRNHEVQKTGTPEEKKAAEEELKVKFKALAKLRN